MSSATPPPPAYTSSPQSTRSIPQVSILMLGSPSTGKTTFLSRLPQLQLGRLDPNTPLTLPKADVPSPSLPRSLSHSFDVTLFRRPYHISIYPSTSTLFIDPFPPDPSFVIITYAIDDRSSLHNAQYYWRKQFSLHYDHLEHSTPVMLLGLKRDLRTDRKDSDTGEHECVMPQEGVRVAAEMRCDRYAECSAKTGELLWEVLEDITRTAALTTTDRGGLSQGSQCNVM